MRGSLLIILWACALIFTQTDAFTAVTDSGCDVSKSCLRSPSGCSALACKYFVSWRKVTASSKDYLEMELAGTLTTAGGYMAIGFSVDQSMGSDGVTTCYSSGSSVRFLSGYTTGRSAPTAVSPAADFLVTSGFTPALGGSYTSASKLIQCRFRRLISPAAGDARLLNLASGNHYILVAQGAMSGNSLQYHNSRWASPTAYNFAAGVISRPPAPTNAAGVALSQTFTSVNPATCGLDKSCFRTSDGAIVSWRPVGSYIEVEMSGQIPAADGYIAVGFSEDARMDDDAVLACVASSSGKVTAHVAYNPPSPRTNRYVSNYAANFLVTSGTVLGGVFKAADSTLSCRFRRLAKPASQLAQLKDLSSAAKFFVLLARGAGAGALGLDQHPTGLASVSAQAVEVGASTFVDLSRSRVFLLAKLHGALMIVAWMVCSAVGIVVAGHFKAAWPDRRLCGVAAWFQVHRALQVGCLLLTAVAFVLIFVEARGYSAESALPQAAHPVLGICVTALCVANPIMAIFRCGPDDPKRFIFNWAHRTVGLVAIILSYPTIIIGMRMGKAGPSLPSMVAPMAVAIASAVFAIIIDVALFVVDGMEEEDEAQANGSSDVVGGGTSSTMEIQEPRAKTSKKLETKLKIKKILLFVLIAGTSIFSLILLIFIGLY